LGNSNAFILIANSGSASGLTPNSFHLLMNGASVGFAIRDNVTFRWAFTRSGLLQAGGTTSSFPAFKPSSATMQVRLADDSAFASVQGKLTTDNAYTAGTVVQTGYVTIYDSTGTAYKVLVGT
jgi:hypothetical protein